MYIYKIFIIWIIILGIVYVWDDINYNDLYIKNTQVTNNKLFLKSIKLDKHCITTILCQKYLLLLCKLIYFTVAYIFYFRVIITGNTNGDILFYDKSLTILYHLNKFVGDAITSIAIANVYTIHNNKGK